MRLNYLGRMVIRYSAPDPWIRYDITRIVNELVDAKASVQTLVALPFQRAWAEALQNIELKREIAGTSKIEGADFTDREFEEAVSEQHPDEQLTRSQRQARSAMQTYRWIAGLPRDRPITEEMIMEVHRRIVTDCDDDHCAPGALRTAGVNVVFGRPRHRGAEGGEECQDAFRRLCAAINAEFHAHDPLVQALALHYHLGAMHPFGDGNGRTARALEALILQRAHLRDTLFIAMSNYYYDEKSEYLRNLSFVGTFGHDLTPFLKFGLKGIAKQCQRIFKEIRIHIGKSLYRDVMATFYGRLRSTRKRALAGRQVEILTYLLGKDMPIDVWELYSILTGQYGNLKDPRRSFLRDMNQLIRMKAISIEKVGDDKYLTSVRLDWATEITETEFYRQLSALPEAKTRLIVGSA